MENEINYLVRCIMYLQEEVHHAITDNAKLELLERRENLLQALIIKIYKEG